MKYASMKRFLIIATEIDDTNEDLPQEVLEHYIGRALKHFHEHDDQRAFDGLPYPSHWLVKEIEISPYTEKVKAIHLASKSIKELNKFFEVLARFRRI